MRYANLRETHSPPTPFFFSFLFFYYYYIYFRVEASEHEAWTHETVILGRRRRRVANLPTPKNRACSSHKETGKARKQDLASGLGTGLFSAKDSETLYELENAAWLVERSS